MGNINHFGPNTTKEILVDRMIGDSFTVVKELWEQIPTILFLIGLHEELEVGLRDAINQIENLKTGSLDVMNQARLAALREIQASHEAAITEISTMRNAAKEEIEIALANALDEVMQSTSLAEAWASAPAYQEVVDGKYSAYHYAQVAATIVSSMSTINWHPSILGVDLTIPDGYNAWSAGPEVTIPDGVTLSIGEGSYWTVI